MKEAIFDILFLVFFIGIGFASGIFVGHLKHNPISAAKAQYKSDAADVFQCMQDPENLPPCLVNKFGGDGNTTGQEYQ